MEFYKKYSTLLASSLIVLICFFNIIGIIEVDNFYINLALLVFAGIVLEKELKRYKEENNSNK